MWKFTVHILLESGLEIFAHYLTSMWDEYNCIVVWAFFGMPFFGIRMKTGLFPSCCHCWVLQICWHIECSTFTASYFRIWSSSTGIPSPPLAFFVMMLPKAHLTSHSRMFGSQFSSVQSLSLVWLFATLESHHTRPPVHHQLLEFTQTHVHRVGDTIQPSHPLLSPSPTLNPSQHQGLFQWVNSLHEVAKVLEFQLQHQSFQWTLRT